MVVLGSPSTIIQTRGTMEPVTNQLESGKIYRAEYPISGLMTLLPGWESNALNATRNEIESVPGNTITYINIDTNARKVIVEWRYVKPGATPIVLGPAGVAIAYAVVAVAVALGLWFIMQTPKEVASAFERVAESIKESPVISTAVIGIIAVGGLFAGAYLLKQIVEMRRTGVPGG